MNQSARPETAEPAQPQTAHDSAIRRRRKGDDPIERLRTVLEFVRRHVATFASNSVLTRPQMLPLALPGVVCALAVLYQERIPIRWLPAASVLLTGLFALAGIGALISAQRLSRAAQVSREWTPLRLATADLAPENAAVADSLHVYAMRMGYVFIALATLCGAPLVIAGPTPAMLVMGLAVVALATQTVDVVRQRLAPFDELIAPLCLGPGLVALTVITQGRRMTALDWIVAVALGCMALAYIEGRRLRADTPARDTSTTVFSDEVASRLSFARLFGRRGAATVAIVGLVVAYALAVSISVVKSGAPGALLAITSLPVALLAVSGIAASDFEPARRVASNQLAQAYTWYGLALAVGLTLSVLGEYATTYITHALGG